MYWIYLLIFVLIVFTPEYIRHGWGFLNEEDVEALLIFCFGMFGFMIYLAKEKALLKIFREKSHLQKQTSLMTRDLSESYSYIGEMNRRVDIIRDLVFNLPREVALARKKKPETLYDSLLETAGLLGKTDHVLLCFLDIKEKQIKKVIKKGVRRSFVEDFSPTSLLAEKRFFWTERGHAVVRSPKDACGIAAFLIFTKATNHVEDSDVFKMLVAQALLLYTFEAELSKENVS